nr:hypothetical protein [Lachnospiraceae bacterium]
MRKKTKNPMWKRILAVLFALALTVTMVPAGSYAAPKDTGIADDTEIDGETALSEETYAGVTSGEQEDCGCDASHDHGDCGCADCNGGVECTCDDCADLCDCGSVPEDTDEYGSVTGNDRISEEVEEAVTEEGAINADKAAAKKPVIKSAEFYHKEDGTYEVQIEYEGNEGDYNVELYNVKPAREGDPKTELGLTFVDGKPYHIIGLMTIDHTNSEKYYKNDKGRWVIKDVLYYVNDSDKPTPGTTTQFTVGTIGPNNNSELTADPISIKVPEKGKKTTAKPGSSDPGPVDTTPDLGKAKVVGKKTEGEDYTEKEAKRIGLEKPDGTPLVKGKDYTEEITTSEDGENWLIKYKPVEGKSKGDEITVEVKKAPANVHNVTVNYVLPVTGQPVAPAVVRSYPEGTGFSIESPTVSVPTAEGKYYTPDRRYVNGHMGTEDLEYSVEYTYQEITALTWFTVEVNYVIENKEGDTTQAPPKVKQYRHGNEAYSIESPPVEGYLPDAKCVSGTVRDQNVAETVTYRPKYRVKIVRKTGFLEEAGEWILADDEYPDGAAYSYDPKELLVRQASGSEESGTAARYAWASETAMRAAWTVSPAQVSGTINHEDVEVAVTVTCSHPQSSHLYIDIDDGTHNINCRLCGQLITESEAHIYGESVFMTSEELAEAFPYGGTSQGYQYSLGAYKRDYPGGASVKICKKCGNVEITDTNEERCPASPADENYKHLWSGWEKINDNQCSRTCARCKKTETVSHAWGNWESATGKTHVRRCSLCHCSETGDHGAWSNIDVKKRATCIENAEVSATCGICNKQVNNVYFGIVPTMGREYEKQGHQFDGGLVKIHGGHTQKCSVCGAFDM